MSAELRSRLQDFLNQTANPLSSIELSLLTNANSVAVEQELTALKQEGAAESKDGAWISASPLFSEEVINATCSRLRQALLSYNYEFVRLENIAISIGCNAALVEEALTILKAQGFAKSTTRNRWAAVKPKILRTSRNSVRGGQSWGRRPQKVLDALRLIPKFEIRGFADIEPCTTAREFLRVNGIQPPAIVKVKRGDISLFYWGAVGLFSYAYFEKSPLSFPEVTAFLDQPK